MMMVDGAFPRFLTARSRTAISSRHQQRSHGSHSSCPVTCTRKVWGHFTSPAHAKYGLAGADSRVKVSVYVRAPPYEQTWYCTNKAGSLFRLEALP